MTDIHDAVVRQMARMARLDVQAALDNAAEATRKARDVAWDAGASGTGVPVPEVMEALDAMRDHQAASERNAWPLSQHHAEVAAQLVEAIVEGDEVTGRVTQAHMHCACAAWLWSRGDA